MCVGRNRDQPWSCRNCRISFRPQFSPDGSRCLGAPAAIIGGKSYALYRECAGQVALRWEIKPDRQRIPDTTPWTKPPYCGTTIALWRLYSAFILSPSRWTGPANGGITAPCYRRFRCRAMF